MQSWRLAEHLEDTRRTTLESVRSFSEIASEIATSMEVLCTHADPCDEVADHQRLVSCVVIDRDLFDLFFNASCGYRACYFKSEDAGLQANADLLELIAPTLVAFQSHPRMSSAQATYSLKGRSAKVWLAEVGKGFCPKCKGEWKAPQDDTADILNGRWELGAEPKAKYGRKAPRFTKLRILGAFVTLNGGEYVTVAKRDRAKQIHEYGWS